MWNLVMALWRSGELGMVQFSWNWNVPVTSDHERMHWKSIGIGLFTEKRVYGEFSLEILPCRLCVYIVLISFQCKPDREAWA